jgi:hypothetical protein
MIEQARAGLTPGISASRATAGRAAASGPVPGVRAGGPVRVHAPGGGHRGGRCGDPGGQLADPGVAEGGLVQQELGELAVVVIEHAGQGLDEVVVLSLHPGAGQGGQRVRVAFPGDHGLDHVLG